MTTFAYMTVAHEGYANPEFGFSDRIRKIRREIAHMTQQQMADELGVTQKAYAAWESGRNKPDDIVAIAKRIAIRWRGVTAGWVLGVSEVPPSPDGDGERSRLGESNPRPIHYEGRRNGPIARLSRRRAHVKPLRPTG